MAKELGMEKDLKEVVERMSEFYYRHGAWPAKEVYRVLGDPMKGVSLPKPNPGEPKK